MITQKQHSKMNELMRNWWNGNLSDAGAQVRKLTKRELAFLLLNQQELAHGAYHAPNVLKFQKFVVDALE